MNVIDLNGRRAVVTGAAQGIGLAVSKRLLQSGASVSLWDRDAELLRQTQSDLEGLGPVDAAVVDVTDGTRSACRSRQCSTPWEELISW